MVTINTPEELLRALRENPEWKEAVRREILTEELMNLPARFEQFVARTEQFVARTEQFVARTEQFIDEQRQFNEAQRQFNTTVEGFMARTDQRFARMEGDISEMKDTHAIGKTVRDAEGIAHDMGYKFIRTLSISDLLGMVTSNDTADLETRELRSFRLADLVIEATDGDGATHYIAMEVSYTADRRDISRTIRNAGFLTRFTGHPAHPAVASIRNDREIQNLIDSGQVYWYELEDNTPRPGT